MPARLWAGSPLTRQQRPNGTAGAMGPRVGGSPGPWCSPEADTGWGRSLGWGCSRGPMCAVGLLQEGRGEVQGLGVRVLWWWVAASGSDPPCAPCLLGQSPALGYPPCASRALGQNLEWPRPKQLNWPWQQHVLPVCVSTAPSADAALAPAAAAWHAPAPSVP